MWSEQACVRFTSFTHTHINCTAGLWQSHTHRSTFSNMINVTLETTGLHLLSHIILWRNIHHVWFILDNISCSPHLFWGQFSAPNPQWKAQLSKHLHRFELKCDDAVQFIFPFYFLVFTAVFNLAGAQEPHPKI